MCLEFVCIPIQGPFSGALFAELICDKTDKIGSVYMWSVLQVEGGDVGPNMGSVATPPSGLFTPSGAAAQLRCGAGFSEPVQRY